MSWRDDLRRVTLPDGRRLIGASFRGVPFFVESADRSGGRRTVTHEFPGADEPFVEDLGRRARVLRIEGYVVGADYVRQRDALLAALEDESGPGELVHPYHGVRRAICSDLSVRETRHDGGMAVLLIELTEAPASPPAPTDAPDRAAQVDGAATAAIEASRAALVESYDVDGEPAFALGRLISELRAAAAGLQAELAPIAATTQQAAKLRVETELLERQASSLVRQPEQMLLAFVRAVAALAETATDAPRALLRAFVKVHDTIGGTPPAPGATATRKRERANQKALAAALRRVLIVEAARLAPRVRYETLDDAVADANALTDRLDEQAAVADTTAYPGLVTLRARVRRAVPGDAILARLITVERPVVIPSLLLSYQLYGSVAKEADIIARNRIRHPGVVSGRLQVLSHV